MTSDTRDRANFYWNRFVRFISSTLKNIAKHLTWMNFVKFICLIVAILLIVALVRPDSLPEIKEIKPETILLALAIALLFPYISNIEALGVKIETREQVIKLSGWVDASSYYPIALDFEEEGDSFLAEEYYKKCLEKCDEYWPAHNGIGCRYQDLKKTEKKLVDYDTAIYHFKKVIKVDPDNIWGYCNLATEYLNAPPPIKHPQKALDFAEKILDISPSYAEGPYLKGEALNYLHRYQEAYETLKTFENGLQMKDQYWALLELAIAKSNYPEKTITPDDLDKKLDQMYEGAEAAGKTEDFLYELSENQEQFSISHQPRIKEFLTKKGVRDKKTTELDVTL